MIFVCRPIIEKDARIILSWRYEKPFDFYDLTTDSTDANIENLLAPENHYFSMFDENDIISAFCCFGIDARVGGGNYLANALDIGGGLRPDLTGQGLSSGFFKAMLNLGDQLFEPSAFRTTVAAFNQRALRACEKTGFRRRQSFVKADNKQEFIILQLDNYVHINSL